MNENRTLSLKTFPALHYRLFGHRQAGAPALVFLHGFPDTGAAWNDIYPALEQDHFILIPDLPGAGGSKLAKDDLSMEELAAGIQDMLEAEQVTTVKLIGHSMGGYVALAFAARYPAMVKGLALVHSSAYADDEAKKETRRKAIQLMQKPGGKEAFIRQMIPNLFSLHYKEHHKEALDRQIARALQMEAASMISFYNCMINRQDRTQVLTGADFPVLWVIGEEDTAVLPGKALQQSRLADVSFVSLYRDCAHMSMLEQRERLVNDLRQWLSYRNNP